MKVNPELSIERFDPSGGVSVLLFHDLTQILRLCLPGSFDPKTANAGVLALLARAADLPDFPALQAYVVETQRQVRECFVRILGGAP